MHWLKVGYQICLRTWKKLWFRPIHIIFSFVQPIFWLTIFGFLFERHFEFAKGDYLSYLLPGVCAMTVIQSSSQAGILFIKDFQTGFFGRYNFTSISRFQILFFKIFADFSRILIQVFVLVGLGAIIGVDYIKISPVSFLLAVSGIFMFTYFYAALSSLIAIKTKTSELMATFVQLFNLPIIFTSTALVPNKGLPGWLNGIAKYNPLSHLSNILRTNLIDIEYTQSVNPINSYLLLFILMFLAFLGCYLYLRKINYE